MNTLPLPVGPSWCDVEELGLSTSSKLPAKHNTAAFSGLFINSSSFDFLCRVNHSAASTTVTTWQTAHVAELISAKFVQYESSIETLRSVIYWQKNRLDYDSVHSAYLLGTLTEEEFLEEADKFMRDTVRLPSPVIAEQVAKIEQALNDRLSPSDYADYLGVEIEDVLAALPEAITSSVPGFLTSPSQD